MTECFSLETRYTEVIENMLLRENFMQVHKDAVHKVCHWFFISPKESDNFDGYCFSTMKVLWKRFRKSIGISQSSQGTSNVKPFLSKPVKSHHCYSWHFQVDNIPEKDRWDVFWWAVCWPWLSGRKTEWLYMQVRIIYDFILLS